MTNPGNVAGGHKANLNNPNTSEESKQHSKEVLDSQYEGGAISGGKSNEEKNPNNVAGGLKATTKNPNVSEQAKQDAKARLDAM
ncbi:MAG: hypothetical protein M1832_003720 [Thelocarpon impressellum]|nr:MAG: hypothetical protein M1832_003720 [Thelocarpon impressellum]